MKRTRLRDPYNLMAHLPLFNNPGQARRLMNARRWTCRFLTGWLLLALTACGSSKTPAEKRAEHATHAQGDIVIGVVDSSSSPSLFVEGVQLAVEDLMQQGGLLGRAVRILAADDLGKVEEGQKIARSMAANQNVIAVVGHSNSTAAIPASIIYEHAGILFLSPGATHPNLTRYGGDFTFRNIPSDEEIGRQAAAYASRQGYRKIVIFYERDDATRRLSEIFHTQATALGIEITATRSYFAEWENDFREVLSDLKKSGDFDAIFIAGMLPTAGLLIKQARDMGITAPILGGDDLDSPQLWAEAGRAAEGVIMVSVFDPTQPSRLTRAFVKEFNTRYGVEPDTLAAQGYDAIQVLAAAIERSDSTVPIVLATTLRFLEHWEGVTGSYSFTRNGDVSGKSIYFKIARSGGFEFLERDAANYAAIDPFYVIEDMTLRLPLPNDIETLDPAFVTTTSSSEVIEQIFLGLTDFDPQTYQAVPELAENWTISDDGAVYHFHLRQDAVWTDGAPITAHDVVWTMQRNILPETQSPLARMLYVLKNAQAIHAGELSDVSMLGVRALDDLTVEFTLERPIAYFPALTATDAYRPLPRHVLEKYGQTWTDPDHIQTNGSYRPVKIEKGVVLILQKNPTYYEAERVAIPEVRYYIVPSRSLAMAMYERNELDIIGGIAYTSIPVSDIARIQTDPDLQKEYKSSSDFCTVSYFFNTRRPPVDQVLVRKAIIAAIDRQLLVDFSLRGGQIPAKTYVPFPLFGAVGPDAGIGIDFNPAQARQWLAEAGYPDGKGFPEITVLYNISDATAYSLTAHPLKQFLKQYLKIEAALLPAPWQEYIRLREQPDTPHLFRMAWCADTPDAYNFLNDLFHPFTSSNRTGWENKEFAELMENSLRTTDQQERKKIFARAERLLCEEEAVVIPLYHDTSQILIKPRVKGWYPMSMGGQHIRNWSLQK